jgi:hypothetical protein
MGSESETGRFEAPPAEETPASWERVEPRYFGLTPYVLVAALAALLLGAGIVLLATGRSLVGALLLVAGLLLAALYAEQARRRRASSFDRVAAAAVDHVRALGGFAGVSARAWTHAGREVTRLRLEASRCARARSQLQYDLGAAVYLGDDAERDRLLAELRAANDRIERCVAEAHDVVARARTRTAGERFAAARTEINPPG